MEVEQEEQQAVVERDPGLEAWEHERLIIHLTTFKRMMAIGKKDFPNMFALYCFYFAKARKDNTNQPWAVDNYCMKGLGWSKDRFHKAKKLLIDNEFIEQIKTRDEKGKMSKFYIKVNCMNKTNKLQSPDLPTSGKNPLEGKSDTSALTREEEVLKVDNNNNNTDENKTVLWKTNYGDVRLPVVVVDKHSKEKTQLIIDYLNSHKLNIDNVTGWVIKALEDDYILNMDDVVNDDSKIFARTRLETIRKNEELAEVEKKVEREKLDGFDPRDLVQDLCRDIDRKTREATAENVNNGYYDREKVAV